MAVYYFARSDVKSGCVFPINGMDMRRIVRTTAYQLLPPKTTFAKTSPKQRAPISRFMFNALNGNNALALVHGIQNDVRPDESPAIPQRRDNGIDRKRICERGRLKYPDKSLVRIEQSGTGLLATRAVLQIRKRFSHILHCRIRLHHGEHGYKPNSSRKRETPSRAG